MEQAIVMTEGIKALLEDIKEKKVPCADQKFQCSSCFNGGFKFVNDPKGSCYTGVVRCDKCKYWAFRGEF